jgi:hypothetical protein
VGRHGERGIPEALQDSTDYGTFVDGALGERLILVDMQRLAGG